MGYRSDVAFKTTTEGYVLIKKWNDEIEKELDRPLTHAKVQVTDEGFYKITYEWIKWVDVFAEVKYFINFMEKLKELEIPYAFIRIGEDYDDIEYEQNYTEDMPTELEEFYPERTVYDWHADTAYTDIK